MEGRPQRAEGEKSLRASDGQACGKAIVVGEHAVVYGARAVAMPIPSMRFHLRLTPVTSGEAIYDIWIGGKRIAGEFLHLVDDAFLEFAQDAGPLRIDAKSNILIGAGVGSSAAICVGLLRALGSALGQPLRISDLASMAHRLERRFHGKPSGLDTAIIAYERVAAFSKAMGPVFLDPGHPSGGRWHFAIVDSDLRSSTKAMIEVASPYFRGEGADRKIDAFDRVAQQVTTGFTEGDTQAVADGMMCASRWLVESGVVTDPLSRMIDAALDSGALAAKVTGAGGGGCVLALLPSDPELARHVLTMMGQRLGRSKIHKVDL